MHRLIKIWIINAAQNLKPLNQSTVMFMYIYFPWQYWMFQESDTYFSYYEIKPHNIHPLFSKNCNYPPPSKWQVKLSQIALTMACEANLPREPGPRYFWEPRDCEWSRVWTRRRIRAWWRRSRPPPPISVPVSPTIWKDKKEPWSRRTHR